MLAIVCLGSDDRPAPDGEGPPAAPCALPQGARTFGRVRDALRDGGGDVVLLRSRTQALPGWGQRLVRAAEVDDRVATVSALSLPVSADGFADCADRVRAAALCLHPALPIPHGPCILLRRSALELVGWPAGEDDAAALPIFAAACTATGLLHVLADDTLVRDDDPGRASDEIDARRGALANGPQRAPLARARRVARRAIGGLTVTIDARLLDEPLGGSQVYTLALIGALAKTRSAALRVLLGPQPRREAQAALGELELSVLTYDEAIAGADRSLVVHRPMQVSTPDDMALLRLVGERIVVTHHDGILFHNPSYFSGEALWGSYRRLTSQALAEADRVIFSTRHARDEAVRDEIVSPQRSAVVALGTDHALAVTESAPPEPTDERPFLLCLGSDLRHKNRLFAMHLTRALRDLGWNGRLVLAGGRATHGSSAPDEQRLLAGWPQADDVVLTLDHVREPEREWLMRHCAAVVFASVSEGFGLPPFEAARREVPCLYAPRSAMAELLPDEAASIVPWDAAASARRALPLLTVPAARARHLALLRDAAAPLTWQRCASELIDVYEAAARAPIRAVSALVAQADERERYLLALDELTIDLRAQLDALGPDAVRLVGRDGVVPRDVQRALLAAAARRPSRAALFALLRAGYRVGHREG